MARPLSIHAQREPSEPITGVRDPRRLQAVADADLVGHLGDDGLNAVVATLKVACDVPMAVVNIVSTDLQTYAAEIGVGAPCSTVPDGLSFCAEVVDSGSTVTVPDAANHPVYSRNPLVLEGVVGAYAGVPLIHDGFVFGSVSIFSRDARAFTDHELEILRHQAQLASSVLALRRSARTDFLTGLPNRRLYLDRLDRALGRLDRHPGIVAVAYLDVNNFKHLNDRFGHDVGDQVLAELATRLSHVMRTTDTLARFGGDEFVAVCEDMQSAHDAELLAQRMVDTTGAPWLLAGKAIRVAVSVGIAVTRRASTEPAALLRAADAAMYQAKAEVGSRWVLATSSQPAATAS